MILRLAFARSPRLARARSGQAGRARLLAAGLVVITTAMLPMALRAQRGAAEELGLSGYVLAPDGTPVSGGSVVIQSAGGRTMTPIDRTGRFRLVPHTLGLHQVFVSVSGLAPYRVRVSVPSSRTVKLPVIRLSPGTYFRVRFVSAAGEPITSPRLTWPGGGGRVEATASANGEALLEGVGTAGGTLAITARGYQPGEETLSEPPAMLHEVALMPAPVTSLQPRVISTSGEPISNAVVELSPASPIEVGHVAVTDAKGFVTFSDAPPGALRLLASADGFVTSAMQIPEDGRTGIVFTLSRGHRVIVSVESPAEAGPHLVRVMNEAGTSMEGLLDSASDRSIEPPGRISLGPLPPGTYVVELHDPREQRRERIRIVDRDVYATFR